MASDERQSGRGRRRVLVVVIVLALVAALANVPVAWMCATQVSVNPDLLPQVPMPEGRGLPLEDDPRCAVWTWSLQQPGAARLWGYHVPAAVPRGAPPSEQDRSVLDLRGLTVSPSALEHDQVVGGWPDYHALVVLDARGWPFPALSSRSSAVFGQVSPNLTRSGARYPYPFKWYDVPGVAFDVEWGIPLSDRDAGARHWALVNTTLPLKPVWPGFVLNTGLYFAVLATTFALLAGASRLGPRAIRARRGQCVACGYPLGLSDRCSECGREKVL